MMDPSRKATSRAIYEAIVRKLTADLPDMLREARLAMPSTYAVAAAYALTDMAARLIFLSAGDDGALARYLQKVVRDLEDAAREQLPTSANARAIEIARARIVGGDGGSAIVDRALIAVEDFRRELDALRREKGR